MAVDGVVYPPSMARFRHMLRQSVWRNTAIAVSLSLLLVIALVAIVGPFLVPYGPVEIGDAEWRQPPSRAHVMGTDNYGRDILSRLVHAARLDLLVGVTIAVLSFSLGSLVGAVSGYLGGLVDDIVMRAADIIVSFPAFILALGITAMLGTEVRFVTVAVAVAYTPYFARITRSEMLSVRERDYAAAARCAGNPPWRIIIRHLLPNCISVSLVQACLAVGWAILDVAGLSFLGLGIQPPTPEWGVMVRDGVSGIVAQEWWIYFFPGAAIALTAMAFNLLGDGLRDVLAPESR